MSELLFPALLLGHMLGDWVFQSDYMAANKLTSAWARAWHVLVYTMTVVLVSYRFVPSPYVLTLFVWMLVTHFAIDSRRWRTSAPLFVQIVADQTLHVAALFAFIVLVGGAALAGCTSSVQAAPQAAPMHVPAKTISESISIPSGVVATVSGGWLPDCESEDTLCINNAREGTESGFEQVGATSYRIYNERGETLYWLSWKEITE